jgi:hypothetical protein
LNKYYYRLAVIAAPAIAEFLFTHNSLVEELPTRSHLLTNRIYGVSLKLRGIRELQNVWRVIQPTRRLLISTTLRLSALFVVVDDVLLFGWRRWQAGNAAHREASQIAIRMKMSRGGFAGA